MGKALVIVESPAKARTINRYLGNDYIVKSSVGHIRDLPTSGGDKKPVDVKERTRQAAITRKLSPEKKAIHRAKKAKEALVKRMGIDPDHGWKATYQVLPGKEKVVNELSKLAKNADAIYLATDMDREGEAIAWHLQEAIGEDADRYHRVVFNEITKSAIHQAFEHPGPVDMNRVYAQQARRFLDRVVGFMVSPLLWAKIARGLSAGRVQSVAVRLIVERERGIRAFIPQEYWELVTNLRLAEQDVTKFDVKKYQGEAFKPVNEQQANDAVERLKDATFVVSELNDRPTSSRPSAPFITSTLQQAASTRLGFGVKKTMTMAQRLYEAGHITYMRTDSTNLSKDAVAACRGFIQKSYGDKYLPPAPVFYSSKGRAQEAHEAIRPSSVTVKPNQIRNVDRDARRLYQLIWSQFVACQMTKAEFLNTTVTVTAGDYELITYGRVIVFDGYQKVMAQVAKRDEDRVLPNYKIGDQLDLAELLPVQHFTKPPARYTEASLVKELEKRGIGRPSTYASIISTIQDRGYVRTENRRFYAEKMGDIVTERLTESFNDLMDYGFTAHMESSLDDIAQGRLEWHAVLDDFYSDFSATLTKAQNDDGMRPNAPTETDIKCEKCGRNMQIRTGSTGVFLGCSGYALPEKERCKNTMNLMPGDEAVNVDEDEEAESKLLIHKHRCVLCNTAMDSYSLDETRKLHICGNNPDCLGFEVETGTFKLKGYEGPTFECDKCGSEMQLKNGRFGKYFGCTNETCKNTRKLLRSGEVAPPKMDPVPMPELQCLKVDDHYLLRDGASGLFLAASKFPRNRETRAPLVAEILPHKDEIDPKYAFLFDAPVADGDGVPTVIRYSRKTKKQYVQSEVDGKLTGWKAFYQNGQWVVTEKAKPAKKKTARKKTA